MKSYLDFQNITAYNISLKISDALQFGALRVPCAGAWWSVVKFDMVWCLGGLIKPPWIRWYGKALRHVSQIHCKIKLTCRLWRTVKEIWAQVHAVKLVSSLFLEGRQVRFDWFVERNLLLLLCNFLHRPLRWSSLSSFERTNNLIDFSQFLTCF